MVASINTENDSFTIDLMFEPMELYAQVRGCRKVLTYVYMSNLKVLDLIEHIN